MIKVVPAILAPSFASLEDTLSRLEGIVSTIQIDVVDGKFAPNTTWPYVSGGKEEFERMLAEANGSPLWKNFDFEVDLMVEDVREEGERWIQAGAMRLIFHEKSTGAVEALTSLQHARGEGQGFISLGISLMSDSSPNALWPFEGLYDFVQVMGIKRIGYQGEAFDERALTLISRLRAENRELTIAVDGGVRMENISKLVAAGANRLVVGSLILSRPDIDVAMREIIKAANN